MSEIVYYLFCVLWYLLAAYGVSTLFFLVICIVSRSFNNQRKRYLAAANTIAAGTGYFMAAMLIISLISAYFSDHTIFRYRLPPYLTSILFLCLLSSVALLRGLRQSLFFTLLLILGLNIAVRAEMLYEFLASLFSISYFFTSWSYYTDYRYEILYIVPFSILYFLAVYMITRKKA